MTTAQVDSMMADLQAMMAELTEAKEATEAVSEPREKASGKSKKNAARYTEKQRTAFHAAEQQTQDEVEAKLSASKIGRKLKKDGRFYRVGAWIWAAFVNKPTAEQRKYLRSLGFSWSRKRQEWRHPCGVQSRGRSQRHPKYTYGESDIA